MKVQRQRSGLDKSQTRQTLESFNWTLGLRSVFDVVCGATAMLFTTFALSLGVTEGQMGLIGSVVSWAALAQLVGLFVSSRIADKKGLMITLGILEPLVLIVAIVSLPLAPPGMRIWLLALAAFCAASFLHLSKPVTDDWVAQSVPAALRPRFVGWRTRLLSIIAVGSMLGIGYSIEFVGKTNSTGLGLVLLIGAAFGVLAALPLRRASMPDASANSTVTFSDLVSVFRDKPFVRFLIGIYGPLLPFFFVLPFYSVYQLKVIGIDAKHLAWINITYFVLRIGFLKVAEHIMPRLGARAMFLISAPVYAAFFFIMGTAQSIDASASREFSLDSPYWRAIAPLALAWIMASVGDSIWNVAQGTVLYGIVPQTRSRPAYFAAFNLMSFVSYAIGPAVATWALSTAVVKSTRVHLGPFHFGHFQLFFLVCAVLMLLSSVTLFRMPNHRDEIESGEPAPTQTRAPG